VPNIKSATKLFGRSIDIEMFANSTDKRPNEFVLFPFTNPTPRKNRYNISNSETSVSLTSKRDNITANVTTNSSGHHKYKSTAVTSESSLSGFTINTTIDQPNRSQMSNQNKIFSNFENDHTEESGNDDARWVEFGIENSNETTEDVETQQNELSPLSMKVQLGQADAYEAPVKNKYADYNPNDDTVTSTTEYDDDLDYGPSPLQNDDTELLSSPPLSTELDNEDTSNPKVKSHILMLVTNMGMNRTQVQNQQRATMMLNALNISYDTLDGSDPDNKDIRNELFKLSDMRGMYPQFFIVTENINNEDVETKFLGDFETIEGINDSSSLPMEILDANPTLLTWDRIPYLSYRNS
jgi:hypothetical protein